MEKNNGTELVQKWIADGCDYAAGCELFATYGENKILAKLFPRKKDSYQGKLFYELTKAVGLRGVQIPETIAKLQVSKSTEIAIKKTLPIEVTKVIDELSKVTGERAKLHSEMVAIAGNDKEAIEKRKKLSDTIHDLSDRYELLYAAKEAYWKDKTLPDITVLFSEKVKEDSAKEKKDELPESASELKALKKKLQTSLSKDKNQLDYQQETKQKEKSPMPAGPKRLTVEKRIKEKMDVIEAIDYKLVDAT